MCTTTRRSSSSCFQRSWTGSGVGRSFGSRSTGLSSLRPSRTDHQCFADDVVKSSKGGLLTSRSGRMTFRPPCTPRCPFVSGAWSARFRYLDQNSNESAFDLTHVVARLGRAVVFVWFDETAGGDSPGERRRATRHPRDEARRRLSKPTSHRDSSSPLHLHRVRLPRHRQTRSAGRRTSPSATRTRRSGEEVAVSAGSVQRGSSAGNERLDMPRLPLARRERFGVGLPDYSVRAQAQSRSARSWSS